MRPQVGMKVTCRYQGKDHTAYISGVYQDDTFDLAVMRPNDATPIEHLIIGGLTKPSPAKTLEDRLVDGHYWQS